jgi:hypothetical protein
MYSFQNSLSSMSAVPNFQFFFRLIDALQETLSLIFLREVEVKLDDAGSVDVEVSLPMHDGPIPFVPHRLLVAPCAGQPSPRRISGCTRAIRTSS